jgi:Na+/H+-translocating membrane pyrophosphatase
VGFSGYGFGASFVALFMQLGGGIYTKAADVGADMCGKIDCGIPEVRDFWTFF